MQLMKQLNNSKDINIKLDMTVFILFYSIKIDKIKDDVFNPNTKSKQKVVGQESLSFTT